MSARRMITFLGAPSFKDVLKTWDSNHFPPVEDTSCLPPFEIDLSQRTTGIVWRRFTDPIDSLSQELAETTMESRLPETDLFLERSLQIFSSKYDDDDDTNDTNDTMDLSKYSELSVSNIYTPFLTGYDFDVNEITELGDLPEANVVASTLHRKYSIIVAITEISPLQQITTKYGNSIKLVKLTIADQTKDNLEIACWEHMALISLNLRTYDIVYFRGTY